MRAIRWLAAAACVAAAASSARPASAQSDPFRPALDTRGFVTVDGGEVLSPGAPSFGIVTTWTRGLMEGVDDVVMPTLVAAIGLPFGLELAASLPFSVISADGGRSMQEVGDLAIHGKARVLDRGRWALAIAGGVTLPDRGDARAIVEWRGERLRLAVNAGARGRDPAGGAAASWALAPGSLDLLGELGGPASALEATLALRVRLAVSSHFTIGAGTGVDHPQTRAFAAIVFEPRAPRRTRVAIELPDPPEELPPGDRDRDTITDDLDQCDDDPEDLDEHDDADGCPDPDNDRDRILDSDDLCLDEPEDVDGDEDGDGCPERDEVGITDTELVTLREINFEFDSDVIEEGSYGILEAIARTLESNPDLTLIEIGGHTDARGKAAYNLDLSDRRASAVRRFLIDLGVDEDRLTAVGYGETRPAVRGTGERVWEQNRRVEFVIKVRR